SNLFLSLILHLGNLFLIVQLHFSKLFLILKSGVNHTSRGSISTSTLPSIKLRKCSSKIITSILSFISGRLATKSNQIKQLIRNGRSASLQRTFKKSFTSFSHSTRNKTRDGLIRVRNIRALNGRFNTSITHAYSIVIGSKHITLNATGGGFLTASKQFRHGATSKSRSNTASNSTKHKSPHLSGWRQIISLITRSEERFSRNAETEIVCRLLLEKKNTNLAASAVSTTQINISWSASTDSVGVAGYHVYRGGTKVAIVISGTVFADTGLTPGTVYSYAVDAYDAAGNTSTLSTGVSTTALASHPL